MNKVSEVVGPTQFKVNGKIIDLQNDCKIVTRLVAEPAYKLLLYVARKGCGGTLVAKGILVAIGSDEYYDPIRAIAIHVM